MKYSQKIIYVLMVITMWTQFGGFAQEQKPDLRHLQPDRVQTQRSVIQQSNLLRQLDAVIAGSAKKVPAFRGSTAIPEAELDRRTGFINSGVLPKSATKEMLTGEGQSVQKTSAPAPILNKSIPANRLDGNTSVDNAIAISGDGFIVSMANSNISMYDAAGKLHLAGEPLHQWLQVGTSGGEIFSPKVIYDATGDRFIMVVLQGKTALTSKVILCVSESGDPTQSWNVYTLPGNPLNDNSRIGDPQVAISDEDIFITGNLYAETSGTFNQSMLYQMSQSAVYSGSTLNWIFWPGILDGDGHPAFGLLPVSNGHKGSYGPGIYLVSSLRTGGSKVFLYDVTDNLSGNPLLQTYTVTTEPYSPPGNAQQMGSSDVLNTGDCRILSGFYLSGGIHYVFNDDVGNNGHCGIQYNRLHVSALTNFNYAYGMEGLDFAYPSVASFTTNKHDRTVIIGYLKSGATMHPESGAMVVNASGSWSEPVIIQPGESHVDIMDQKEPWGAYTGIARNHSAPNPDVWIATSYGREVGTSRTFQTRIAEFGTGQAPQASFTADTTYGHKPLTVHFKDLSDEATMAWNWTFPGGNPSTSTDQNPVVTYNQEGYFDVTLEVVNFYGASMVEKIDYIHVDFGVGVERIDGKPFEFDVYPNPVKDRFTISFQLEKEEVIDISIYSMEGRLLKKAYNEVAKSGLHYLSMDRVGLSAGTYILNMNLAGQATETKMLILTD